MLFRLVRPLKRTGSRHRQFVRRIPSDVRSKAVGLKLSIPVGEQTQAVHASSFAKTHRRADRPESSHYCSISAEAFARLVEW